MNTRNTSKILAAFAALLFACSAQAVTITLNDLIGTCVPGTPSGDATVVARLNYFIGWNNTGSSAGAPDLNAYTLDANTALDNVPAVLPGPAALGLKIEDPFDNGNPVIPAGYNYLLGKWGDNSAYFWLGGLTGSLTSISNPFTSGGLSHITLFSSPAPSVPDSGAAIGLLGIALLLVEAVRRRVKKV